MKRENHGATKGADNKYERLPGAYRSWLAMRGRCLNPNHVVWAHYGGRGITICPRWLVSFQAFLDDMGPRPEGHTLDRVDPEGPYSPENCRWASYANQIKNRRGSPRVVYNGVAYPIEEGCAAAGVNRGSLCTLVHRTRESHQAIFDRLLERRRVAEVKAAALRMAS
jgi:hypothetical protein